MFRITMGRSGGRYCDGLSRRSFLQLGVAGMASVGLPEVLRATTTARGEGGASRDTRVILVWMDGGPGHMDMYDLKPEAPAEYRGIWSPIKTNVPGIEVTELFPLQARIADKFSIVRSLHHNNGDHFTGAHWMLTGRDAGVNGAATAGKFPFFGSIATKVLGPRQPGMPANVSVPYSMSVGQRPGYFGGNYLGNDANPFETEADANSEPFKVPNINLLDSLSVQRLEDRRRLLNEFDRMRRNVDRSGLIRSMDRFDMEAYDLVANGRAREAFDIGREDAALRERYGRNSWGQSALLARRLVEAGVTFVTCHLGGWDHHWDLKKGMEDYLPRVDRLMYGLLTDLEERGLTEQVLVVVCGEFSRTPRMNDGGNGGAPGSMGTPGRDHWGNSMFCILAGGGLRNGQVVGSTDRLGETPKDRPLRPGDIHQTIYRVLGVDPHTHFLDRAGRPSPAIDHGSPIEELL